MQKDSPMKFFGFVRQHRFNGNSWYSPFLSRNFFLLPETFWKTEQKGSPTQFFGTAKQQTFCRKSWYSPLRHKKFQGLKLFETQKGSSTKFFGIVRPQSCDGKSWYPLPIYTMNFFATAKFLRNSTEGFLYEVFSYCETTNFLTKTWYSPLKHKKIRFSQLSEKLKGYSKKFLGTLRQQILYRKS